jgi:xanthine/uracil permease
MIPIVAPTFFEKLPASMSTILHSGVLLASGMAVVLNLYFNGKGGDRDAAAYALAAAQSSEH